MGYDTTMSFFKTGWLPLYTKNGEFRDQLKCGNWVSSYNDIIVTCHWPLLDFIIHMLLSLFGSNSFLGIPWKFKLLPQISLLNLHNHHTNCAARFLYMVKIPLCLWFLHDVPWPVTLKIHDDKHQKSLFKSNIPLLPSQLGKENFFKIVVDPKIMPMY